jgi:hypothetical protein
VLELDPAAVGEESTVERVQRVGSTVHERPAGRLPHRGVGPERRQQPIDVPRHERPLVVADDAGHPEAARRLEDRRADRVAAGQRPAAEVHALLDDPPPLVLVTGDGHGEVDIADVQDALLDPAAADNDELDVLRRSPTLGQPASRLHHEALERGNALDPPAHRVMQLRLAGRRSLRP